MRQDELKRYEPLYIYGSYFGAADILRRYLNVGSDFVVPLGLPHGVDFGQVPPCLDLVAPEPIHWAHNERLYRAALPFKPALRVPHPFLLAGWMSPSPEGEGTLIVGPPPGPENDQALYDLIRKRGLEGSTILIKPKSGHRISTRFWEDRGFGTATIAAGGTPTYDNLLDVLSRFRRIVGCTFSSALIFGAALGREVELLRGYRYRAYDVANFADFFGFDSEPARNFVRTFAEGPSTATAVSRELLGEGLEASPDQLRAAIDEAIERLNEPVNFASAYPRPLRRLISYVAAKVGRPGLVTRPLKGVLWGADRRRICIQEIDEISIWLDGRNTENTRLTVVPYRAGVTVPGNAVESYVNGAEAKSPA